MSANAVLPPGSFDPSSLDFAFQPHPDHGMERQGGARGGANGGQGGGYVTGATVGGVVMLDERSQEEYDRSVFGSSFPDRSEFRDGLEWVCDG